MPTILSFLRRLLRLEGASRMTHPHIRDNRGGHSTDRRLLLYFGRGIGGVPLDSRRKRG